MPSQAVQSRSAMSRSQEFVRHSRFTIGADGGGVFSSHCGCYFQKSLNLSSGDISVYRGADSRPQRLDRLYHVTPNNAPPTTTATSESSMVTRLRSSSMITALR